MKLSSPATGRENKKLLVNKESSIQRLDGRPREVSGEGEEGRMKAYMIQPSRDEGIQRCDENHTEASAPAAVEARR